MMAVWSCFPSKNLLAITLLLSFGALVYTAPTEDPLTSIYEKWISNFGRAYKSNEEKQQCFEVFKKNNQIIQSMKNQPDLTYTVDLNEFTDLNNEEFLAKYVGFKSPSGPKKSNHFEYANLTTAPTCTDWRSSGAITPVKDQGNCGSDWAFSAIESIESICRIRTGTLMSLSEQELIDCCSLCSGCNEGYVDYAFECIIQNFSGCSTTESDYPYSSASTGSAGSCNYPMTYIYEYDCVCRICYYQQVTPYCESCLKNSVAIQPVSAVIDASGSGFQFYSHGIFMGPCGTNLNHAVSIIGYGPCLTGTSFWIRKNSWGTFWGKSGYIRMQRNVASTAGLCGIAIDAYYPILC